MNKKIRVVTVDDHPLVREGLRLMLATSEDLELIGDASEGAAALRLIEDCQPDVVLLDLRMPGLDGMEVLEQLRKSWPQIAVLILTTYDEDELVIRGLQLGACGYLLKETPIDVLFHAIRTAARGEILVQPEIMARILSHTSYLTASLNGQPSYMQLTRREQEVLAGVARGERSKEIAAHLGITERTVRAYLTNIYTKLNVDSRASAVAVAKEHGLI
jgi:two-component system, NarL family, response regulator YdfI